MEVLFAYCCAHMEPDPSWNTGWIHGHVKLIPNPALEIAQRRTAQRIASTMSGRGRAHAPWE